MSCREWEEPIALFVDGEPGMAGLAEHLEDCDACRQLLRGLRADQAELQVTPALDSAACETLRSDVLQRIGLRSRTVHWWYVAAVAIAAGLMIVSILVRIPGRRVESMAEKPKPTTETQAIKHVPSRLGQVARVHKPLKKRLHPPTAETAVDFAIDSELGQVLSASPEIDRRPPQRGSASEVTMRIQTSDTNVVIMWIKEEVKGGSNE